MKNPLPSRCIFVHPAINALHGAAFRLTEGDRVPALAIRLDGSEAVVTLSAVAKLFEIAPGGADDRMLELVAKALDFVHVIRPGDVLPAEILTGEASWQPSPYHRNAAAARLQLQLLNWIGRSGTERPITSRMLVVSAHDPAIRPRVQDALRHAAEALGLDGGPKVAGLIEDMAGELAYFEALRERLLVRVQVLVRRIGRLDAETRSESRRETLMQVNRLAATALAQLSARFDHVDAQVADVVEALRALGQDHSYLRSDRDWLYCNLIAWEEELRAWDFVPSDARDERLWRTMDRLYRFLAPRYMEVQVWRGSQRP